VVWAVVQLVGCDGWVKGVWNTRWGVGTARAGEGGLRLIKTRKKIKAPRSREVARELASVGGWVEISLPTFFAVKGSRSSKTKEPMIGLS